jgi:hypothetical protein
VSGCQLGSTTSRNISSDPDRKRCRYPRLSELSAAAACDRRPEPRGFSDLLGAEIKKDDSPRWSQPPGALNILGTRAGARVVTTVSMGVPSRTSASTPALDQTYLDFQIILGKVRPFSRHLAEAHPQVPIIAPENLPLSAMVWDAADHYGKDSQAVVQALYEALQQLEMDSIASRAK